MATPQKITDQLLESDQKPVVQTPKNVAPEANVDWHDFEYKQFGGEPKITYSKLTLIIAAPVLICLHVFISNLAGIPMIQYSFVTMLVAFLLNYTAIIRKHQLMPYLPNEFYDFKLKILCLLSLVGVLSSIYFGWNGSGGIIVAIIWEQLRGNKMGVYGYFFLIIIAGSLLMEKNYTLIKLVEFIPGFIFGYINSNLYTLRMSSTYAITHQFIFLCSVGLPVFFPASNLQVPSILQWVVMIVCGVLMLGTVLLTVKLMQEARVSVVMGVMSGLLMVGTSSYLGTRDYIGCGLILLGVVLLIKKEYIDVQF